MLALVFRSRLALVLSAALFELLWWSASTSRITRAVSTLRPTDFRTAAPQYQASLETNDTVKQYVRYNKRGTKQVMKAIHTVHRDDLTDLNDDELFRLHNSTIDSATMRRSKQQILTVLRDAGITEVDDETVALLPTWNDLTTMYGTVSAQDPLYLGGQDTCARFRQSVPRDEAYLGTAGFYNSGTNALTYYLRANLRLTSAEDNPDAMGGTSNARSQRHHDGILTQVPWDKHYFASLKDIHTADHAQSYNKDHILPIVIIRDPLTWWHSMCATPYGVAFVHPAADPTPNSETVQTKVRAHCRTLTLPNGTPNAVSVRTMTGHRTWSTILHLWNDWYRSYLLEYEDPFLMVRFEDLLFRPRTVVHAIRHCANATWTDASAFTYVVDHSKWEHVRFHGPQSTMISAMIKHGSAARRVQGLSADDLQRARDILDPTLLNHFGYHIPTTPG